MPSVKGTVHVAYALTTDLSAPYIGTESVAIFGAKVAALEYAVQRGMKYAPWNHGDTLAEAIKKYETATAPKPASTLKRTLDGISTSIPKNPA